MTRRSDAGRIVADSWYAAPLAQRMPGVTAAVDLLHTLPAPVRAAARRSAVIRSAALLTVTTSRDLLVTTNPTPGTRTLIALTAALRRRNLVLLEYIAHRPAGNGIRAAPRRIAFRILRVTLLPRATLAAHVLTEAERLSGARSHRTPVDLFHCVQWPGRGSNASTLPEREPGGRAVFASGRRTDWPTFFAAAAGADWQLTVVCTARDEEAVRALAAGCPQVRVLVEISAAQHEQHLRRATVDVIAVPETGASIGQIRLMNAADAGVPVIISAVSGIEGYLAPDCVILVPPHDPVALRSAVDALLENPDLQTRLRKAHFAHGSGRSMDGYLDEIAELVRTASISHQSPRAGKSAATNHPGR